MRFRVSNTLKLRFLHLCNHILSIYGIWTYDLKLLAFSMLAWFIYGCLGITIGFHRYLSHKAFETTDLWSYFLVLMGCIATGGSPLSWVGAHRTHHKYADSKGDPHGANLVGFLRVYFHLWPHFIIPVRSVRDLLRNPFVMFCHRHYFRILFVYLGALYLIDIRLGIFLYSVPAVIAFHAFALTNTLGHRNGYRNFELNDLSSNSWISNVLTWGEGWHNNHHRFPSSHRIGFLRYEFDPGAWCIENLPGLAKNRNLLLKRNQDVLKSFKSESF